MEGGSPPLGQSQQATLQEFTISLTIYSLVSAATHSVPFGRNWVVTVKIMDNVDKIDIFILKSENRNQVNRTWFIYP